MNVLVTGGTGFVGSYIIDYLKSHNHSATIGTRKSPTNDNQILFPLNSQELIVENLSKYDFDAIIHLSAKASVSQSFSEPYETFKSNVLDSINLITVIANNYRNIKLIIASSSEVYQLSEETLTENSPFGPISPYGLSKMYIDCFSRFIAQKHSLNCVVARPFNTIGPKQCDVYVLSSFAKQIIEMSLGIREKVLKVGNIKVRRDFVDVREVAQAYCNLLEHKTTIEPFNICSGNSYLIEDCIHEMLEIAGVNNCKIEIDNSRIRSSEIMRMKGSNQKINEAVGWKPRIPIDQTLSDILSYWKQNLAA